MNLRGIHVKLALLLALLLPLQGFAMHLRCADAAQAAATASCHEHGGAHDHGSSLHNDHAACCCTAARTDGAFDLGPLPPAATRAFAVAPASPVFLSRDRLDRPPRPNA
jgi:hypothetical protein